MVDLARIQRATYPAEGVAWTFTALASLLFFIRFHAHFKQMKQKFECDDAILIVSWVLAICRAIFFQIGLFAIRHVQTSNIPGTVPTAAFWIFFTEHWTFLSVSLPKCAIGLMLAHLFSPGRWTRLAILMLPIALCILAIVGFVASTLYCSPVAYQWDPYRYSDGHCWSQVAVNALGGVFSILSAGIDLAFALYPGIVIWQLKMTKFKRLSTMALMGVGLISCAFATIKIVCMLELKGDNPDMESRIWNGMLISFWCSLENDVIICAACLPFTPPFFRACYRFLKKQSDARATRNQLRHASYKLGSTSSASDDGRR